jgi:hypothetical protein
LVQDTQAIVARFNDAASLMETPVSCLLNQLRGHFDQGIDWAAVQSDRNLLVRMKGALRAASDGDLQKAAEICEPLSSDPDYFEHSLESPQHRDAYARAMEFKARSCCSRGSRNEALGYYLRALRVDPERTVLACRVAEILWQLDRIPEALKLMRIGLGSEGNALQRLPSGVPLGKLQHFIDEITAPEASGPEASGGNDEKSRRGMLDVSNF